MPTLHVFFLTSLYFGERKKETITLTDIFSTSLGHNLAVTQMSFLIKLQTLVVYSNMVSVIQYNSIILSYALHRLTHVLGNPCGLSFNVIPCNSVILSIWSFLCSLWS